MTTDKVVTLVNDLIAAIDASQDGLGSEGLDELVHESFGNYAAHVNNGGAHAQVTYLLSQGESLNFIADAVGIDLGHLQEGA